MAFGVNVNFQQSTDLVKEGIWGAKIVGLKETTCGEKNCLEVKIEYDTFKHYEPSIFRLFDVDPFEAEQFQNMAKNRICQFCEATGATLTSEGLNYTDALNQPVLVNVEKQKNGFLGIKNILPLDEDTKMRNRLKNKKAAELAKKKENASNTDVASAGVPF